MGNAVPTEIKVISSTAMKTSLEELQPGFENQTDSTLTFFFGPSARITKQIADGAPCDIAIVTDEGLEGLIEQGRVVSGTRHDIARSAMALAVQHGAPRPDISSGVKFKEVMLAAKTIGMSNPVGGGQSGANLMKIFEKLGIADAVKSKCLYGPGGPAGLIGNFLVRKEIEVGIQQLPELMAVPGIDVIGPLPPDIQIPTVFSGGVSTAANHVAIAKALLQFLTTPKAAAVMRSKGMEAG